ncbi:hypothetical protein D3C87_628390 [compost metagenome]
MSNSNSPRVLKLKKLPKGKFRWKVTLRLTPGHKMSFWDRYCDESYVLSRDIKEYLANNVNGRYCLHAMDNKLTHFDTKTYKKYDYILFENQLDVTMFKLCHGHAIRRIYKIQVEE